MKTSCGFTLPASPCRRGGADVADDLAQHCIRRLTIGVRIEVQDDPVPQYRGRDLAQVIGAEIQTPAHQRQYPAALYQRLRPARRASVGYVLLRQLLRALGAR